MSPGALRGPYAVLYVDDEKNNLLVFSAVFGEEFQVYTAATAAEALAILEREPVGVAIIDQRMPGMSGIALAVQLRARYPRVARMIVTAYSDAAEAVEAINRAGISHWIRKPWEAEEVAVVLRDALARLAREDQAGALQARVLQAERLALRALVPAEIAAALPAPPPPATRVDLRRVLEAVLPLCRVEVERRAVLRLELTEAPEVTGDEVGLGQVLRHLLVNAGQAIPPGHRAEHQVRVVLGEDGGEVVLEVHDTGEGIPPEHLETIFEPFVTTRGEDGAGLGLALVRRIVEAHRGTVTVRTTPGAGSVFQVRLPAAPPAAA